MAVLVWVLWPRLGHSFPSLIDDWSAIADSPSQLRDALLLGMPEELRYRPAWVVWNNVQWYTLGAPVDRIGPQFWGLVRVAILIVGLTAAAAALSRRTARGSSRPRSILVAGAVLAVVTVPAFAVDIARFGPQEPLLVGLMCGGAALFAYALRRALDGEDGRLAVFAAVAAVPVWWAGVGQKESSVCALVLVPFIALALRSHRRELSRIPGRMRTLLWACAAAGSLAFVPVVVRTVQLAAADERVYGAEPQSRTAEKALRQLAEMGSAIDSPTGWIVLVLAIALIAGTLLERRPDWLAIGLLVTAFAFLAFAGSTEVVVSRYYIPTVALLALVATRLAPDLRSRLLWATGCLLLVIGLVQAPEARARVQDWVAWERAGETLVREGARRQAAGCRVDVTGPDIELVDAYPVLVPFAGSAGGGCETDDVFLVVLTGNYPLDEDPEDPHLRRCGTGAEEVLRNEVGRLLRCQ